MMTPGYAVDPIIGALIARLPEVGSVWPETERNLWLDLMRQCFKLIYKDPEVVGQEGHPS